MGSIMSFASGCHASARPLVERPLARALSTRRPEAGREAGRAAGGLGAGGAAGAGRDRATRRARRRSALARPARVRARGGVHRVRRAHWNVLRDVLALRAGRRRGPGPQPRRRGGRREDTRVEGIQDASPRAASRASGGDRGDRGGSVRSRGSVFCPLDALQLLRGELAQLQAPVPRPERRGLARAPDASPVRLHRAVHLRPRRPLLGHDRPELAQLRLHRRFVHGRDPRARAARAQAAERPLPHSAARHGSASRTNRGDSRVDSEDAILDLAPRVCVIRGDRLDGDRKAPRGDLRDARREHARETNEMHDTPSRLLRRRLTPRFF